MPTVEDRFWEKVQFTETCWLWTACTMWNGYGVFWTAKSKIMAHRFSYQLVNGPIPEGMQLDHLCRIRNCVRPDHLEVVDHRTNVLRGTGITALNAVKTSCIQGHPFTKANTLHLQGKRRCLACREAYNAKRRQITAEARAND